MSECNSCGKSGYVFLDNNKTLCDECYNDLQLSRSYNNEYDDDCRCKACNGES